MHVGPLEERQAVYGIGVRKPYFALREVESLAAGKARASVPVEQPLSGECGPVAMAEVLRHLGVLGACAVAAQPEFDGEHIYLPQEAKLWRSTSSPRSPRARYLAEAELLFANARVARTRSFLFDGTVRQFSCAVVYQLLPEALFRQEFPQLGFEPSRGAAVPNPFSDRLPLRLERSAEGGALSRLELAPSLCAGHFPSCPIVPLDVLLGGMIETTARSVHCRQTDGAADDAAGLCVLEAGVVARSTVLAGGSLAFHSRCVGRVEDKLRYSACALDAAERTVAEGELLVCAPR